MSEVWPLDAKRRIERTAEDAIRPFKCLLLMPFESRFNQVAQLIQSTATQVLQGFADGLGLVPPIIQRLDWVSTAGVIQQQIWQEILESDLIFCDITGYNTNVIFECGVSAAWKDMRNVVFIKDRFFKQPSAFDIAPFRYIEYELTSEGTAPFQQKIANLIKDVLISYPDEQGAAGDIASPLHLSFKSNVDDMRIYTPPFAHRRVIDGTLEFGSIGFFPHSWASIGKKKYHNFSLEIFARFAKPLTDESYIGVGFRSQHYYANFAHILYLKKNGRIIMTQPNEDPPHFYKDLDLRPATSISIDDFHRFRVRFDTNTLDVQIDDFSRVFEVKSMPKVFGPGLIRFQSFQSWIAVKELSIEEL